ncbi:hypothetical protein EIN_424990 [Entamoeba invadens IP1]|uniref:Uncharacterized protein n=1 Tax=Entamoeba invadens IP1 TaxID=370355 RepID=A0A0A1U5X6_ENTIV|nr:hypothetical protein EIN_424990 [Entamoeba invadens IP1]ELP89777.1 hypothetical protein EIN_424990 [Entamoeba invadens IP1]|eukprot:XP_004256548.1 hypothetical protein EIN_424990 [Entamoeba invadens IP1]
MITTIRKRMPEDFEAREYIPPKTSTRYFFGICPTLRAPSALQPTTEKRLIVFPKERIDTTMTPMETCSIGKPKVMKQFKHIGVVNSPFVDRVFWKAPSQELVVYTKPSEVIEDFMRRNDPKRMELCD